MRKGVGKIEMKKTKKNTGLNLKALLLDNDLEMLNGLTQKLIGLGLDVESADNMQRARNLFHEVRHNFEQIN